MTSPKYPTLHSAIDFATACHYEQDRKYNELPYITHPLAVMEIVRSVTDDENMLCAAVLHDVVEDTDTTIDEIREHYGDAIADLVDWLTDVSTPDQGNRAIRKEIDRQHTAQATPDAKTIKLADLIHNKEGDSVLWERAYGLLVEYQESLLQRALA